MKRIASVHSDGFTLIELVITILLVAILSAVAVTRITAQTQHSVTTQADQLRRNLSHIQLLAISQGMRLRLTVTENDYTVTTCTTPACTTLTNLIDPATGENFKVPLTDGVSFDVASRGNLDFDTLGRPQLDGSLIATNPARTYTLSGSGRSVSVTVLPITGFAQTSY